MLNSNSKYLIIYDIECPLCVRFKKGLSIMDIKNIITFKELQDQSIYIEYPQLNFEACSEEIHMIDSDGKIYLGGEVISQLIQELPGASKLSWLIEKESSKKTLDFFYKSLNKIRTGTTDDCPKCNRSKKTKD